MMRNAALGATALAMTLAAGAAEANTLRWAFSGDVVTLDPFAHTESFTSAFLEHIYEPLVRRDRELGIEPALATSWEIVEPDVWRFKLREGVTFHDGAPFTADDVVASITRVLDPDARARGRLLSVKEARKVDDLTVELVTDGPYPLLLNDLNGIHIMDAEWLKANDAEQPGNTTTGVTTYASTHTNGTGPFMLESYRPDQKTVLTVNEAWWDEPEHNLTRIEFMPIKSDATRVAALLSGEIDMMVPAPLQDIARLQAAPDLEVVENPSLRTIFFGMNQKDEELHDSNVEGANPLKDVRVRKALWMGIDTDLLNRKVMRGTARVAGLLAAPAIPGYDASLDERPPHDVEGAKKLLAEAGYPEGFSTNLSCPNDRYVKDEELCVAVAAMWARIGVKANVVAESKTTFFPKVDRGETDIYLLGWATLPQMDTYSIVSGLLATPDGPLGGNNAGGYANARIDEIAVEAATELDTDKRLAMMAEALRIARDEVAYIPLHQQPIAWAMRSNVDVPQFADEYVRLRFARID